MSEDSVTRIQPHEQVLLLTVERRSLDVTSSRELTDEVLTAVAARAGVPVVLDLSRLRFVPSAALGSLLQLSKSLKLDGRHMALIGVGKRVMEVIRVTQLHTVIEIHDTLKQVIDALPKRA